MNAPLVRRLLAGVTLTFAAALHAETSTWIVPGPVGLAAEWQDAAHWDNGIVPDATDAVAVFSTYTSGQAQSTNYPGTAAARIGNGDVSVGEIRWQLSSGGSTQWGPEITLGGNFIGPDFTVGTLRLYGAGLTSATPQPAGFAAPSVNVTNGVLEFNQAASAGAFKLYGTQAIYSSYMATSQIVFRDQSSAGSATITAGHQLRFEDSATAWASSILVHSAGNDGDAYLSFQDQSGAGLSTITLGSHAHITFSDAANAQTASITVDNAGPFPGNRGIQFFDQSGAGRVQILLGDFTTVAFRDSSSAQGAKITAAPSSDLQNDLTHRVEFRGNSKASEATIGGTMVIEFYDQASADVAQLTPGYRGFLVFHDQSTANQAHIQRAEGSTVFRDESTAANATVETYFIGFQGHATAGTAHLAPRSDMAGATVRFAEWANAQSAEIFLGKLGRVIFTDDADAGTATIRMAETTAEGLVLLSGNARTNGLSIVNTGGTAHLDISGVNRGDVELRSISGPTKITLGDNSLVFRASGDNPAVTLAGVIGGNGGLAWDRPTTLTVTNANNTFTGATILAQGELHLAGGRIAGLETSANTRVTGQGKIDGNLYSRGLVSPGSSAGTLTIAGDYTQVAGATLNLEILPDGYDRLVIGGTATLGGTLNLAAAGSSVVGSTNFDLLTASAVTGQFSAVNTNITLGAALGAQLNYTTTGVRLAVTQKPFAGFGGDSPAATALGAHLDATLASSTGEYRALIAELNTLSDAAQIDTALNALAPDRYSALVENSFLAAAAQQAAVDRRLATARALPARGLNVFVEASTRQSDFDATAGLPAASGTLNGATAGGLWQNGSGSGIGVALVRESGELDLDAAGSRADLESVAPSVFVQYAADRFFVNAAATFSEDDYELQRRIVYSGQDITARATASGSRHDFSVNAGGLFRRGDWAFTPQAGLLASQWQIDGFTETGAAGANMAVSDQSIRSLRSRLGFEVAARGARFTPHLAVTWLHEFEEERSLEAAFAGAASRYAAPGRSADGDLVQASLGCDWRVGRHAAIYAALGGTWGSTSSLTSDLSAGFRWQF
jgi:autotransporter-associated beta strand protein